jgi:uncharacterized radical SAM superfamily Fe-S cluster-containing enzyme
MSDELLHQTTSLCKVCRNAVPADVVATALGEVWMRKACTDHGAQEVRLSTDAAWYQRTRAVAQLKVGPRAQRRPIELGCPFDCGPCESHSQKVRLPVVTVTSACNLDCPICYVHNKNDDAYHMSGEDFGRVLRHLRDDHGGELDIVNITGGEPTMHPALFELIAAAKREGIHRVTVCSNGLRLAKDEPFVERLAAADARIALSFDTFDPDADFLLQGAHLIGTKQRCMDLLEKHDVPVTLIPVMTKGVNDHEVGALIRYGLGKRNVRHLEIHTMTYTGQGGRSFDRAGRISMIEVLQQIEATTDGLLTVDDFVPSPCAHPLCYQIAYLLVDPDGGPAIPFTRFMSRDDLYLALSDRLYMEPTPQLEAVMQATIDRLWAEDDPAHARTLELLKRMINAMFPSDRAITPHEAMKAGERAVKAVYVHSHMDEETFDTERAMDCCDSNCYADGKTVPVCNYNVLYRDKEAHFNVVPEVWNQRRGGHRLKVLR